VPLENEKRMKREKIPASIYLRGTVLERPGKAWHIHPKKATE
jgi:hypothetical protein